MKLRSFSAAVLSVVLASAVSLSILLPPTAGAQEGAVNGGNVVKVTYKGPASVQTFKQTGPKRWTGSGLNYVEQDRDEWSVYLTPAKRRAGEERIQIDLYTKKVTVSGPDGEESYAIINSWSRTD